MTHPDAHAVPPAYLASRRAALYEPPSGLALPERSLGTLDYVHNCDALTLLRALPSNYINCLVTSPPYFGLRQYLPDGHPDMEKQIGLEATPAEFVRRLVDVFREVKRVLRDDGVLWINMGDSYASGGSGGYSDKSTLAGFTNANTKGRQMNENPISRHVPDIAPKNLLGMPWRLAFALQDDGWILRSDIIWAKKNCMPESVTDRPTKSHEYVFLLAKSEKYWYDADAIREKAEFTNRGAFRGGNDYTSNNSFNNSHKVDVQDTGIFRPPAVDRNKRSVWTIATESFSGAHFATFPQKLIEPMILAGCPHKVCAVCGAPWVRQVEVSGGTIGKSWHDHTNDLMQGQRVTDKRGKGISGGAGNAKDENGNHYKRETLGFAPTCDHTDAPTRPGITLDPFFGSGTTGLVARRLGRHYIGSELNADYVKLARERLAEAYTLPMMELLTA